MEITNYVEDKKYFAIVSVNVTDKFKSCVGTPIENFGYIEIQNIHTDDKKQIKEYCDGIMYFLDNDIKTIHSEIKSEFNDKELLREIKKHLKYMRKKGYLK